MKRYSNNQEINRFIIMFLKQNKEWYFKKGKRHHKLYSPNNHVFPIPSTPSCLRAYQNFKHDLMKANINGK